MKTIYVAVLLVLSLDSMAQNLLGEPIRKIVGRKRSVFVEKGIFHNGAPKVSSKLKAVRHSYSPRAGYERIVFDFSSKEVPRVYGHISKTDRKLYLDFFATKLLSNFNSFGKSKFVDSFNFFPLTRDSISVEVGFKKNVAVDVFYLKSPARIVVDIKG